MIVLFLFMHSLEVFQWRFIIHNGSLYLYITLDNHTPHLLFFFGLSPIYGTSSFHSPCSTVLCFFSLYSCLLHVFYVLCITSMHLSFFLRILWCLLTSIFQIIITTSSSVFLSTCPNHLSLASLMSPLCLPHMPLLLFLLSWSSQSSLFPLSIMHSPSPLFIPISWDNNVLSLPCISPSILYLKSYTVLSIWIG